MLGLLLKLGILSLSWQAISCEENDTAKTLVLVDNFLIKETHSMFFKFLKDRGHTLTFKSAEDSSLSLFKYGELLYDNLIIFAPKVEEFGGKINKKTILDFVDEGGNLLIAIDNRPGIILREIAVECGVEIDTPGNLVIDHFFYDKSDPTHTLIAVDSEHLIDAEVIVGPTMNGTRPIPPLLYKGIGLLVNSSNPLVLKVLSAFSTSYSYAPFEDVDKIPNLLGKDVALIAAIQTRNNARVVFSGSIDFFSNDAFVARVERGDGRLIVKTSNAAVSDHLSQWVFKEIGVIRVKAVTHYQLGYLPYPPKEYTISEMAVYNIYLEHKVGKEWQPFDVHDVQMEFVRIDPFIRSRVGSRGQGRYKWIFRIPDVYGVFKFVVDYKRVGYTSVFSSTQVSVRPLKHTEYERFIESAYPYYFSAFSMMFGVFVFSIVFLHADLEKEKPKTD